MAKIITGSSDTSPKGEMLAFNEFPVAQDEMLINPVVSGGNESSEIYSILENFDKIGRRCGRVKPIYADTWMIGSHNDLDIIEKYNTKYANVKIGYANDGQLEYNITPFEYSFDKNKNMIVQSAIDSIRNDYRKNGGDIDCRSVCSPVKKSLGEISEEIPYRYTLGLGIFDILLNDDRLEDVYVDAPCEKNRIHVTLNNVNGFNSHVRCRTNLITSKREVSNLINTLMRDSGLPYCESNPILETDMLSGMARATIVGYPMSPNGDSVAIRKHSDMPWTLTRMIGNGTIEPKVAGLLSFLIDNRSTFLICGARGAGKSSLLSALMFEFPVSQRILTIEDTMELPGDKMRSIGFKVQSMLIDERLGGDAQARADEALRVSLRLGESAIVLGEVRGEEAKTLYQSMRTGRAGSSILGTIHGDSAKTVYARVVHDLGISPEAFKATDFLVTMGTVKERGSNRLTRHVSEFVSTLGFNGRFVNVTDEKKLFSSPAIKRIMKTTSMSKADILDEIEIRSKLREYLASLARAHGDGFYGPEWIVFANEHLSKCISSGIRDHNQIIDSFKKKFNGFGGADNAVE